ncbi:MAG: metallophosphoesterase [bacterium]
MAEVNLLSLGDLHGSIRWTAPLEDAASSADAILVCGDLTQFGTPEDAEALLDQMSRYCDTLLAVAGNCDSRAIEEHLRELGVSIHGRGRMLAGGVGVCGVSGSNATPFDTPLEYSDEELARALARGWEEIREAEVRIVLSHAPPRDTACDRTRDGDHVGVEGLREFILREQPDLVVCGHIHEARGRDDLGGTPLVNGGMAKEGRGVRIRVSGGSVEAEPV